MAVCAWHGSAAIMMNTCNGSPLIPKRENAPQKSRGLITNLPTRMRIWSIFIFSMPLDTEFARFEPITSSDSGTVRFPKYVSDVSGTVGKCSSNAARKQPIITPISPGLKILLIENA